MPQENKNVERVRMAYELSYPARSIEPIKQWLSRNFRWHQRREWPGRLVYKADELPQLWADIDDTYSEFTLVPEDFTEVGEYVIVTVRNSARLRGSDERVEGKPTSLGVKQASEIIDRAWDAGFTGIKPTFAGGDPRPRATAGRAGIRLRERLDFGRISRGRSFHSADRASRLAIVTVGPNQRLLIRCISNA